MTHRFVIKALTQCAMLIGTCNNLWKEKIFKIILHFIVYFNRKSIALRRCPISWIKSYSIKSHKILFITLSNWSFLQTSLLWAALQITTICQQLYVRTKVPSLTNKHFILNIFLSFYERKFIKRHWMLHNYNSRLQWLYLLLFQSSSIIPLKTY